MQGAQAHDERALMELAVAVARQSVSEPGRVSPKLGAVVARGWRHPGRGISRRTRSRRTCRVHAAGEEARLGGPSWHNHLHDA